MRIRLLLTVCCAGASLVGAGMASASHTSSHARGTLVVAVDTGSAPYAFVGSDGQTVLGLDVDIARALANVIGYRLRLVDTPPGAILSGLASGELDAALSFTPSPARERDADFLVYLSTGSSFVVRSTGGPAIRKLADLCGRSVAVERGTAQAAVASERAGCTRPPRVATFAAPAAAEHALSSGRVQVLLAGSAVAAYAVKQSRGRLEVTGHAPAKTERTLAVSKESGLAAELQDALETVMGDGTYERILARWGVKSGAAAAPRLAGAAR
jgi:polar amino acid transport system substrate-binding protein